MKPRFSYPNSLPIVGGIVGSLMSLSYYLGIMFSQLFVGRPGSTWIIGFFWLPALMLKPAVSGLLVGSIAWLFFRLFQKGRPPSSTEIKILKSFVVLLICASAMIGIIKIFMKASRYAPHVVYTAGQITKIDRIPYESYSQLNAVLAWDYSSSEEATSAPIYWNGEAVAVYSIDDSIIIANHNRVLRRLKLGNDDIRYVAYVYAIPVKLSKEDSEHLAVLAQVRAIKDCYILVIFNSEGVPIFQEILKRAKKTSGLMQKIVNAADGREALVVDVDSLAVYRGLLPKL